MRHTIKFSIAAFMALTLSACGQQAGQTDASATASDSAAETYPDVHWRDWEDFMADGEKTEIEENAYIRIVKALPAPITQPKGACISTDDAGLSERKAEYVIIIPRPVLEALSKDPNAENTMKGVAEDLLSLAKQYGKKNRFGCLHLNSSRLYVNHDFIPFVLHGRAAVWSAQSERFVTELYAVSTEWGIANNSMGGHGELNIYEGRPQDGEAGRRSVLGIVTKIS